MILNLWNILCRRIITDSEQNLSSYIDCVLELTTKSLPAKLPVLSVGTIWLIDSEDKKKVSLILRLSFERPNGDIEKIFKTPEKKILGRKRERINFQMDGVLVKQPGVHKFVVEHKEGSKWIRSNDILLEIKEADKIKKR